jgi:hypothetical protein
MPEITSSVVLAPVEGVGVESFGLIKAAGKKLNRTWLYALPGQPACVYI